jgi:hypothetical protein
MLRRLKVFLTEKLKKRRGMHGMKNAPAELGWRRWAARVNECLELLGARRDRVRACYSPYNLLEAAPALLREVRWAGCG